jgi:hypothetical protein
VVGAVVAAIAVGVLLFWLTTGSSSDAQDARPSSAAARMPQSAAAVTAPVTASSEAPAPRQVRSADLIDYTAEEGIRILSEGARAGASAPRTGVGARVRGG